MGVFTAGGGTGRRIRFKDAVPLRDDRRDLRRRLRRAARAASAERRAETTALLQRLLAAGTPLAEVIPGPRARDGVIEFLDGTQLLLATRRGGAGVRRLSQWHRASRFPVRLVKVQPSFTRSRFRLWFTSGEGAALAEVAARVRPVPVGVAAR